MDGQDRGFAAGRAAVQELVLLQQQRPRWRQEEEEEDDDDEEEAARRRMFGMPFPAATAAGLGQQAVEYGELGGLCESEAGGSSEPEPTLPERPRGGSGSKRSRAAEVHNLSEKRRRSRINEKMKALQSLIPNSNKTDKASMLDEAIEYLKQLQVQVQMLSMRNGVYLNPSYLSGALEPVQESQMFAALGGSNVTASNSGAVVMPPINQSSGAHHSYDQINSPTHNQPPSTVLPSCPNSTIPELPFHLELSQSHLRSFQLPESSEMMFRGEIMPKHHLSSAHEAASLPGNEMNSIRQEPPTLDTDNFDGCARSKEQSLDMVPKNRRHV